MWGEWGCGGSRRRCCRNWRRSTLCRRGGAGAGGARGVGRAGGAGGGLLCRGSAGGRLQCGMSRRSTL
jgi:hypothetical protein